MVVKRFRSEKEAEKWARAFDHARAFNRLKPLVVKALDDDEYPFGVDNPSNVLRTPVR